MAKPPYSIKVINSGTVGASDTGVTTPLWTGNYWKKTVVVKTTTNCNVYVKACPDGTDVGFIVSGYSNSEGGSTDDGDYVNVANNEVVAIPCDIHCNYLVIVVDNQDAAACTVDAWITGVGQ